MTGARAGALWLAISAAVLGFCWPRAACAGQPLPHSQTGASAAVANTPPPIPLALLVKEAERNNPRVIAARRAWQAAEQVPSQVSTLPDPQFTVQQFAVGSPRPFAGFTNSDFAYIGFGVSQEFPYPGKLHLRGEIARRGAEIASDQLDLIRRDVIEQLKASYFQLSYIQQALEIMRRDQRLLAAIEQIAEARYRAGEGHQQDVLKAQLQQTKLLRDIALYQQQQASTEAQLKALLNRPPDSADLAAEKITETHLAYSFDQLSKQAAHGDPELRARQDAVSRRALAVELAKRDFYPDFSLQYMWQHTAAQFRDYYMLSVGVDVPIHWRRKQDPALAEAAGELDASQRSYEAQNQRALFEIRNQLVESQTAARVLTIYRQGLIPQASATFKAGLAAYEAGREDFQTLLASYEDVLNLEIQYWQTLAQHETAIARLERLTGMTIQ